VLVLDRTRNTVYEAKLQQRGQQATIEIWFDRIASYVRVTYGKQIYI
jgi:hypothetical protein